MTEDAGELVYDGLYHKEGWEYLLKSFFNIFASGEHGIPTKIRVKAQPMEDQFFKF
jgi:hypothetical protein